jgi:cell division protease FtsH
MAENDDYEDHLPMEVTSSPLPIPATKDNFRPATHSLPKLMIREALTAENAMKLRRDRTTCLIILAPTSAWVEPLMRGAKQLGEWQFAHAAGEAPRRNMRDVAAEQATFAMARGGRIVGIAQNLAHLPPAMVTSADIVLKIPAPSDELLREAIKAATGRLPRTMPKGISDGLEYSDICGAIRCGSSAKACVDRLVAAAASKVKSNPALADVPRLEDMHGYGEAMVWGKALIADLEAWRVGTLDFSALQRTAVLASPPGLGKTTFARALAKSCNLPFFASSVSSWFANSAGYLDSVIKQIDAVFAEAAAKGPAILLLDEIEGLPSRSSLDRHASWWTPVIGHMLLTLDSASSGVSSKLIIIGATNHVEKLDPALVRPGRLSKIIHIAPPDAAGLEGILRQHLGRDLADENLELIAQLGLGASGADVTGWVKGARGLARQYNRPLQLNDLFAQVAPPEKRSLSLIRRVSVHEAAHAVATHILGGTVTSVTMIGRRPGEGGRMTSSFQTGDATSRQDIENAVVALLAGRASEQALVGTISAGAGGDEASDLGQATHLLAMMRLAWGLGDHLIHRASPSEVKQLLTLDPALARAVEADLQRAYSIALHLVRANALLIDAVAKALVKHRQLSGEQVAAICKHFGTISGSRYVGGQNG